MGAVRRKRTVRNGILKSKGYTIIEIWECQFTEMIKKSSVIKPIMASKGICSHSPIQPREALFGGRVEVFQCFSTTTDDDDDVIEYYGTYYCTGVYICTWL